MIINLKDTYKSFNFVYLDEVEPSIIVDLFAIRLDNFLTSPLVGYKDNRCLLTYEAALALKEVQHDLSKNNFSLKLYDGYRPQRSVQDLIRQIENCDNEVINAQYFPSLNTKQLVQYNYIAPKSSHSRGSTIDVTIVECSTPSNIEARPKNWIGYWDQKHNVLDMGCGVSAFNEKAHINYSQLLQHQIDNRKKLKSVMEKHGFYNSVPQEYWHFTLKDEPYPDQYFDFTY